LNLEREKMFLNTTIHLKLSKTGRVDLGKGKKDSHRTS